MFPRNPFLLYNNLPGFSLLKALLFADETTLFASADTLEELIYTRICKFRIPKSCVIFQRTWNGFPPSKTKCMLFNCSEHQIAIANANIFISYFKSVRVCTRRATCQNLFTLLRIFSTNFLAAFPLKVLADLSSFYFYFGFFSDIKCYSISGKQFGLNLRNLRVDRGSDIPAIKLLGIYIIQYTLYCTQRPSTQLFLSHKTFK